MTTRRPVLLMLLGLALAAGIFAVLRYVRSDMKTPYLEEAMAKIASAQSFTADVSIEIVVDIADLVGRSSIPQELATGEEVFVVLTFSGPVEIAVPEAGALAAKGLWTISPSVGGERIGVMDTVIDDAGGMYLRFDGLTPPDDDQPDLTGLNGEWMKMGRETFLSLLPAFDDTSAVSADGPIPMGGILRALRGSPPLKADLRLGDEVIDGRTMAHYGLLADPKGIAALEVAVFEALAGRQLTADERTALEGRIRGSTYIGDAYVDKRTRELRVFKIVAIPSATDDEGTISSLTVWMTGTDAPVKVSPPGDATAMDVLFANILSPTIAP